MATRMNLRFLETLVYVAELRSFRQAAARLHTTQPAVSARIRALEGLLGVELVDRSGRDVRLTPAGVEAVRYARAIAQLNADMCQRLSSTQALQGLLRLGVIDTIIHSWLPRLIERLRTTYPQVGFELTADTSISLADQLRAGEIDLALLMGPVQEDGLVNLDLGGYPMAWVANPRRFAFDGPIDVAQLAAYPILSYPRHSQPYRIIERCFQASRGRQPLLNCSNSLASLVRLAVDGIGIAAIPPAVIETELAAGTLVRLPVRQAFPSLRFTACYADRPPAALPSTVARFAREEAARFSAEKGMDKALPPADDDNQPLSGS